MAKKNLSIKKMKGVNFNNPNKLLTHMLECEKLFQEATPEQKIEISVSQHALAKAFYDMLCEKFNCDDKSIEDSISKLPPDTGLTLTVNNKSYTYTNEHETLVAVDKAWVKAQGYKSQVELCEDYQAQGKPLPSGLVLSTKTIASFKPESWNGSDPIAITSEVDIPNIKIKEIKK